MSELNGGAQLERFEGLVKATARMFAEQVRKEESDLEQELRIRVWRACQTYDPARATTSLERYVYSVVANKIKDFKRDAHREVRRRQENGIDFIRAEDMIFDHSGELDSSECLDAHFHNIGRDEVYGGVDDTFTMPSNVTEVECNVLLLLMLDLSRAEIVLKLGIARAEVDISVRSLRAKFSDWRPSRTDQPGEPASPSDQTQSPAPVASRSRLEHGAVAA